MKGVALCGGSGSRLNPLTKVTNKALLPVYNKPMVYYPIETLVQSGIRDILLVCGGNAVGEFLRVLGNGEAFGLRHLHYTYQSEPRGIADALGLAEEWAGGEPITVILSDNIFEDNFAEVITEFEKCPEGGIVFGTRVAHPEHYGVIFQDEQGNVTDIIEKPKNPTSNLIATGLYIYDHTVWEFLKTLTPSARGELEITDVNNYYRKQGKLKVVELEGFWGDCGENFDTYLDAGIAARSIQQKS